MALINKPKHRKDNEQQDINVLICLNHHLPPALSWTFLLLTYREEKYYSAALTEIIYQADRKLNNYFIFA